MVSFNELMKRNGFKNNRDKASPVEKEIILLTVLSAGVYGVEADSVKADKGVMNGLFQANMLHLLDVGGQHRIYHRYYLERANLIDPKTGELIN